MLVNPRGEDIPVRQERLLMNYNMLSLVNHDLADFSPAHQRTLNFVNFWRFL